MERASDCWLTPPGLLALVRELWPGGVDLDPFGHPDARVGARVEYRIDRGQDAYALPWPGHRIFVNGPYSGANPRRTAERVAAERCRGAELLNLTPAAPGSLYWREHVWPRASAVAWLGRLPFVAGADVRDAAGRVVHPRGEVAASNRTEIAIAHFGPEPDRFARVFSGAGYPAQVIGWD